MLLLSKSISQLLLPPGSLIILGFFGLFFWKRAWGKTLVIASLSMLWLLSTEPVRDLLTSPLEFKYPALNLNKIPDNHAAIVLLGGGIQHQAPEYQGSDELNPSPMMRTIYAAKIAQKTGFTVYPSGGTPLSQGTETEAAIMKRWLIWFNVPEHQIIVENKANTTWENAVLTQKALATQGTNRVILVTSAWHMPRAVWCFESQGLQVTPAPTDYLTEQDEYDLRSYLPRWDVLADSGHALHEYLGSFWYHLKYES